MRVVPCFLGRPSLSFSVAGARSLLRIASASDRGSVAGGLQKDVGGIWMLLAINALPLLALLS